MTEIPAVSIIVPVRNRARLLAECLDSVAAQAVDRWECLIVDDGSDDDSPAVAADYSARDARFHALTRSGSRGGAAAARNQGLAQSRGDFVIFLDSDDLLAPDCLEGRLAFVGGGDAPELSVFPTLTFQTRPGDRDILWNIDKDVPDLLRLLRLDIPWSTTASFWRADTIRRIGGFAESLPGWQDWQVHIVAMLEGVRAVRDSRRPDSYWRAHGEGQISDQAEKPSHIAAKTDYLMQLLEKYRAQLTGDPALQAASAGLLWYQLVQLERAGRLLPALRHWGRGRRLGYLGAKHWCEGAAALALHGWPGGRVAWSAVAGWSEDAVGRFDRSTCHLVSVSEAFPDWRLSQRFA